MLTKPDVPDERIIACLEKDYGLVATEFAFLPLGADANTAVYQAGATDGMPYFVKLRRGDFDEIAVTLPRFLSDQGIRHIIPPLPAKAGQLWAHLGAFRAVLYPFVQGHDGYEVALSEGQWRDLGAALKGVHTTALPAALKRGIARETYSARWREAVRRFLERVEREAFADPVAAELASLLRAKREDILQLVRRAGELAAELRARALQLVLCHSDLHAGNVLRTAGGELYVVDWDSPVLACKERDLMSVGGGLFGGWYTAEEEELFFYQGYGPTEIDAGALAYYRYERIVQDIAAFCEQILLSAEGGADREQSLRYVQLNWRPGGTIELARRADPRCQQSGPGGRARGPTQAS